jgi:hypothetical protein
MNIELKYKLYLIDNTLDFPEWNMCENLLGNLGVIKENEEVYIDSKYMYNYYSKNGIFWLSYNNIWSFFESEFNMDYTNIQQLTRIYIECTYNLKGINTLLQLEPYPFNIECTYNLKGINTNRGEVI